MRVPYDAPVSVGRVMVSLGPDIAAAVLLTLEAGWELATTHPEVHPGGGEVEITERLRDGMRQAVNAPSFAWGKTMIILAGTESRSKQEVIVPDGRTDIPIMWIEILLRHGEHDPHAIVECKRVAGNDADLCREYVVEGIDRFVNGKYGENHAMAFMAGYLISGDAPSAAAGVNRHLTRKARKPEHLVLSKVLDNPTFWNSLHPRVSAPIELHHALLQIPTKKFGAGIGKGQYSVS